MLDNRLEIRSPGELVEPVTLERLRLRERVHASRNPRIVRVLSDFRYMREKGEGVPRIFQEMEREGLKPPDFRIEAGSLFNVILGNVPVYTRDTMRWLGSFDNLGLSGNQKRLLAYAKEHGGTITSRTYRNLTQVDIYVASQDIRDLVRKGLLRLPKKGGRVYELQEVPEGFVLDVPEEYLLLEPYFQSYGFVKNQDIREALGVSLSQAARIATRLVTAGWLHAEGERRARIYRPIRRNYSTP